MFDESAWNAGMWLWVVIDILAVIVLGVAIAYGTRMWRRRPQDAATLRRSDEATRRMYHPDEDRTDRAPFR
jgi:hypothetical protein